MSKLQGVRRWWTCVAGFSLPVVLWIPRPHPLHHHPHPAPVPRLSHTLRKQVMTDVLPTRQGLRPVGGSGVQHDQHGPGRHACAVRGWSACCCTFLTWPLAPVLTNSILT